MTGFRWEKGYKPRPLSPVCYSMAQQLAARGELPADHPAWKLDAKTEQQYLIDWSTPELTEEIGEDWMVNVEVVT